MSIIYQDQYKCDKCNKDLNMIDIGYLGPEDRNDTSCHPFMKFICICNECETNKKYWRK